MRRANASLREQQWRDTCEANATRIRGSPLIIEQTTSRATCRVWCKPAFTEQPAVMLEQRSKNRSTVLKSISTG